MASFSLAGIGTPGSQARLVVPGFLLAASQSVTRNSLKRENDFCGSFPVFWRVCAPENKSALGYDYYLFCSF